MPHPNMPPISIFRYHCAIHAKLGENCEDTSDIRILNPVLMQLLTRTFLPMLSAILWVTSIWTLVAEGRGLLLMQLKDGS